MALLETIRQQTDTFWAKFIFGAVVLVFVFWGIGASGGPKLTAIAEVNGERITDTQLQRIMRNVTQTSTAAMNEEELNELTQNVIQQLIMTEVLLQEAERLDIEVSDEEVGRYVLDIEAFRTESGTFSLELYERNLKRAGLSRGKFEEQIRDQRSIEKLEKLIRDTVIVSDDEVRRIYMDTSTELSVQFVRIADIALLEHVDVEQASVDAYVAANEDELRASYDEDYERLYHKPARATYSQIRMRTDMEGFTPEAVRAQLEQVRSEAVSDGTAEGFAALARRHSDDLSASNGGAMGTQAEPQIAEAARAPIFAATPGGVTEIIETPQGLVFYRVDEVFPEEDQSFDEAKTEMARTALASQTLATFSAQVGADILSGWQSTGAAPTELLARYGLQVELAGPFPRGFPNVTGAGNSPELNSALSSATGTGPLDAVYPTEGGRIIAAVSQYTEADMTSYEQQKEMIRMQLAAQKEESILAAWRDDLRSRARVVQHYNP